MAYSTKDMIYQLHGLNVTATQTVTPTTSVQDNTIKHAKVNKNESGLMQDIVKNVFDACLTRKGDPSLTPNS